MPTPHAHAHARAILLLGLVAAPGCYRIDQNCDGVDGIADSGL